MSRFTLSILRYCWRFIKRVIWLGGVLGLFAGMGVMLLSRYWLLPNIEQYHDQVTYAVGNAIGQPVTIGRIEADWRGFRPHLLMINVRFLDQRGKVTLALDRVESEVAWTSLAARELRLYSLVLDQPNLMVRRDAKGALSIAGMQLSDAPSDGKAADWLLNQSRIEVLDARITWLDEQRAAPPLVFNEVKLLIENGWWKGHRFALRALPPQELSAGLDVRGDFSGASFSDLSGWNGQLFTQLDYADVAAWRNWVPLPVPLASGKGAVRGWVQVQQGRISQITTDLALSGVNTRLAPDLPRLELRSLHGRVGWRDAGEGMEFSSRRLSLKLRNGFELEPTDFYLRYALPPGGGGLAGEVRANQLNLLGLATLSEYLPFNRGFKRKLAALAPRGKVSSLHADWDWQGDADKLLRFSVRADFEGMAMRQMDGMPGFSGLTGRVDGDEESGSLSLNSRKLMVDAPGVMQEKLQFDSLMGQLNWKTGWSGLEIGFNNVAVANPDLKGVLHGSYHTDGGGPGKLELNAQLTRAQVRRVDAYIPIGAVSRGAHAWLAKGLAGGYSDDVSVRLSGDLAKFPYPGGREGVFEVRAKLRDAVVDFHKVRPHIEAIQGELLIEGARLEVRARTASTAGSPLENVNVTLPDLLSPDLNLLVHGESSGETAGVLDYIRKSPVLGLIGGFTRSASATGNGELKLDLDIPILGAKPLKVGGAYRFLGGDLDLGGSIPLLQQTNGELLFTESSLSTRNVSAKILGGPAQLEVKSSDGARVISVSASGISNMDELRAVSRLPVLRYLHGGSPWNLAVKAQEGQALIQFGSSLAGMASDLPAPFAKRAEEKVPLRFEQKILAGGKQAEIAVQCGDWLNAQLTRALDDGGVWRNRRGIVAFGKPQKWPAREGLWLVGDIPHLSLEGWGPMFGMLGGEGETDGSDTGIAGMDLRIAQVTGFRQAVEDLRITARSSEGRLTAHLASREINGEAVWEPRDQGTLSLHLSNLVLANGAHKDGKGGEAPAAEDAGAGKPVASAAPPVRGESPDMHLLVDNFIYQGKLLGRLELQARQHAGDWLLQHVVLKNPEGEMTASGTWQAASAVPVTHINFSLKIGNVGRLLARMGYPDTLRKGSGVFHGELAWPGGPGNFDYAALSGNMGLAVDDGEFLKIDPQVSGLLRILSLQAFSPVGVFSNGFVFDSISGTARINQGLLATDDFSIKGAAVKVRLSGQVNLNKETQNLKIVVEPAVSGGAALLLASVANPLLAIEFWVVNKFFKGPVEKVASVTFIVTGTWDKPDVSKEGDKKATPAEGGK